MARRPDPGPLPVVLYRDDVLLAFDKPAGLLVAPDRWDRGRVNLADLLHEHVGPEWFNVHRLDRETSGVVLCARGRDTVARLAALFGERAVAKRYVALARGAPAPAAGTIELPLGPDPRRPGAVRIDRQAGKPAVTDYAVVETLGPCSLVRLEPRTGRSHQLRVHLAALGCPIVADRLYGGGGGLRLSAFKRGYKPSGPERERPLIERLALHAERIAFAHPADGRPIEIAAPWPRDFELAVRQLRRHARR